MKEYIKFLEGDKAFDRRFQKIMVEEASVSQTKIILSNLKLPFFMSSKL